MLWSTDWPLIEPAESVELVMEKLVLTDGEFETIFANKGMGVKMREIGE